MTFVPLVRGMLRACLLLASGLLCAAATAQPVPLIDTVHTVADSTVAVPIEHQFTISVAGTYALTLTDLSAALTPSAPLADVKLAITNGPTVVGQPITAAGTTTFSATPGTYTVHVVGTPGPVLGSGLIGILVASSPDNTPIAAFSDQLAPPSQLQPGTDVINEEFGVRADGSYVIKLTDLQLPQALNVLTLALTENGSISLIAVLNGTSQSTVTLQAGARYKLFAAARNTAVGGLYNVTLRSAADNSVVLGRTRILGGVSKLGTMSLAAGGGYTLSVSDLGFPAAVTQLAAVVVQDENVAATLAAAGTLPFSPPAGSYDAYGIATPADSPGVGSYAVQVLPQAGAAVLSTARAVTAVGSAKTAYSFDTIVAEGGSYVATLHDFAFPGPLVSANFVVAQGGALLSALLNGSGSVNVSPVAGPLTLLAVAEPDPTAGGLFGVSLATPGGTVLFDGAQGVGKDFVVQTVSVTTPGNYDLTASDVRFPADFASFSVAATRGTTLLGSVAGHGQVSFAATPGNYLLSFLAKPATAVHAGTYALNVTYSAPTVSLTSNVSNVAQGGTATLSWSATNADDCTASGGWTGKQNASGTAQSAALTTNTTFTLTCTGSAGSTAKSVSVTVDPPPKSGGGGGKFEILILAALAAALGLRFGTAAAAGTPRRALRN